MTEIVETSAALLPGPPAFELDIVDDTPEVVIDLQRVRGNIDRAAATAAAM